MWPLQKRHLILPDAKKDLINVDKKIIFMFVHIILFVPIAQWTLQSA